MGIVNRFARGFLSLLDSQTQGTTPNSTADQISPTIEMSELLYASKGLEIEATNETSAPALLGIFGVIQVPAGEMWLVRRVVSRVLNNDGAIVLSCRFYPAVIFGAIQTPVSLMTGPSAAAATIAAGNARSEAGPCVYPLVINEGAQLVTFVDVLTAFAGANPSFLTMAHIHRLKV